MAQRIGHRQQQLIEFVRRNPGCSAYRAAQEIGPMGSTYYGYATVHRAINANLIKVERDGPLMFLYPSDEISGKTGE